MWTDLTTTDLSGQRVFVRCDFNVPLKEGTITDDTRITASLPTIRHLMGQGCELVLASHLGRPKGPDPAQSLAPVAKHLTELLGIEVPLATDYAKVPSGKVVLLENLRFHAGEESNDPAFAAELAKLATTYVDDAFGTAHRPAASIVGIAELLPSYPGLLLYREVEALSKLLSLTPDERPFAVVIGGAKVSDKLPVLHNLLKHADLLFIGGAMAFTFLKADGASVGLSLVEEERFTEAQNFIEECEVRGKLLFLPEDAVLGTDLKGAALGVAPADEIPADRAGFDIGPETIDVYLEVLEDAGTIFWNGPMGVFENPAFANGTNALATGIADMGAYKVAGGGDSLAAIHQSGAEAGFDHLSTGGGASLELLSGIDLPGVAVLRTP